MGLLGYGASLLGTSEAALTLLVTLLAGYPLALFHRKYLLYNDANLQHLFCALSGFVLIIFNYGWDVYHSIFNILFVYFVMFFLGGTKLTVAINFTFCMGYLIIAYIFTATEGYDIKWTMPHCILALRLIGLTFDVYDGQKDPEKLPHDQKKTALSKLPTLLEVLGHSYFYGGFMVGPQFPMRRYLGFIQGTLFEHKNDEPPKCVRPAMERLALGVGVMLFYQIGSTIIPDDLPITDYFGEWPFWLRYLMLGPWQMLIFHKYVACWLIAEGSCILAGLTYNGKDDKGQELWDGCRNINVWHFETTLTFDGIIRSFNINTNLWVAQYVFKRLRFLGNKNISQAAALLFLALWHGLHSGYYMSFVNEFLFIKLEREGAELIERIPPLRDTLYNPRYHLIRIAVQKIYVMTMFGYCVIPFFLLKWKRWSVAYNRIYWCGFILAVSWLIVQPMLFKRFRWPKPKDDSVAAGDGGSDKKSL